MAVPNMTNNDPTPGMISWDLFHIQYEGVGYEVLAGSTDDRWVWWEYNAGNPVIQSGAVVPDTLTADDLVLFANKNGIAVRVQGMNRIDGELLVDGSILTDALAANIITSQHIVTAGLDAGVIKFGTMSGDRIEVGTLLAIAIKAGDITALQLSSEAVTTEKLRAGLVTADKLETKLIWTTEQYVGQIHIHPDSGITIPQKNSKDVTHFAADGSGNSFAGGVTANDGLISYGGVNMQGTDNFLAGELKAGSGVADPSAAPSVTSSYTTVSTGSGVGFYRKGLCDNSPSVGNNYLTTDTVAGNSNVHAWAKAGGDGFYGFNVLSGWSALGGITRIGAYLYVLCSQNGNPTNWRILVYKESDQSYQGSFSTDPTAGFTISTTAYPAIGNDGVSLVISWVQSGKMFLRKIVAFAQTGAGTQTGNTLDCGAWDPNTHVQGAQYQGGTYYVASTLGMFAYTPAATTAARETSLDIPKNIGALAGMFFDGTTWQSFTNGDTFTKHTSLTGRWLFAYDFRDADPAGSGTANTRPSPIRDTSPPRFANWDVNIPQTAPDDLTTDGANTCRIFAAPYGSSLVFQHQLVTDGDGISGKPLSYSKSFSALSLSGVAPNVTSDFANRAGAIGRFSSAKSISGEPLWHLDGDGSGKLGNIIKWDALGNNLYDSGWIGVVPAAGYSFSGVQPQVRVINGITYFKGFLTKTAGFAVNTLYTAVMTIPAGFRPDLTDVFVSGNIAANGSRVRINTNGTVDVSTGATAPGYVALSSIPPLPAIS